MRCVYSIERALDSLYSSLNFYIVKLQSDSRTIIRFGIEFTLVAGESSFIKWYRCTPHATTKPSCIIEVAQAARYAISKQAFSTGHLRFPGISRLADKRRPFNSHNNGTVVDLHAGMCLFDFSWAYLKCYLLNLRRNTNIFSMIPTMTNMFNATALLSSFFAHSRLCHNRHLGQHRMSTEPLFHCSFNKSPLGDDRDIQRVHLKSFHLNIF